MQSEQKENRDKRKPVGIERFIKKPLWFIVLVPDLSGLTRPTDLEPSA